MPGLPPGYGGGPAGAAAPESTLDQARVGGGDGSDRISARRAKTAIGAQVYRQYVEKFATNFSNAGDYAGAVSPLDSAGNFKSTTLKDLAQVRISEAQAAAGLDATNPDTPLDGTSLARFFAARQAFGGPVRLALTDGTNTLYLQCDEPGTEQLDAAGRRAWRFAVSRKWLIGEYSGGLIAATNVQAAIGSTGWAFVGDLVDAARLALRADLAGHEDDFYAGAYDEAILEAGVTDKRFGWALASGDGSAAPVQADVYHSVSAAAPGKRTLIVGATQWARIPRSEETGQHAVTADEVAAIANIHSASPPIVTDYPETAATGAATKVGAGNGAWFWVPVTLAFAGSAAKLSGPTNGNVWRISAHEPSTLELDIPWEAIGNAPWVKPSGTEKTDATLANSDELLLGNGDTVKVGEVYEHHDQFHTGATPLAGYSYVTSGTVPAAGDVYVSPPAGGNNALTGLYAIRPKTDDDKALLLKLIRAEKRVRYWVSGSRYVEFRPSGTPSEAFGYLSGPIPDLVTDPHSYRMVGAALVDDLAVDIQVESRIPARGEFAAQAFTAAADTIAGEGSGGTGRWEWQSAGGQDDGAWVKVAGGALPASAAVGQAFTLTAADGSNAAGFYVCLAADVWTAV